MTLESPLETGTEATSNASEFPLAALWRRVAEGDPEAIRQLYHGHHVAVRAFAARLIGDASLAEDLVQEVFVALPRAAAGFRGECAARTFLLSIVAKRASKFIRAAARRRAAHVRLEREPAPQSAPPDEAVQNRQLVERLMTALDALPEKLRIAFVLCQIEERDSFEVAAILDVPAPTVRARLRVARERLQVVAGQQGGAW